MKPGDIVYVTRLLSAVAVKSPYGNFTLFTETLGSNASLAFTRTRAVL